MSHIHQSPLVERLAIAVIAFAIASSTPCRAQFSDFAELSAKAAQGNAGAQFKLGVRYHSGEGVPKNHSEALKWFQKSADQNYAPAQSELGYMHEQGHGTAVDFDEAVKWYRRAAEQGLAMGRNNFGALVNERGHAVGITSRMTESVACQKTGALPQNVNYAVKSACALTLLESQPALARKPKPASASKRKFAGAVKAAEEGAALVFAD